VKPILAQTRMEMLLTLRRGESFVVTLGIPLLFLVFFSSIDILDDDSGYDAPIDFLAPGILALAIISTSMVSLGISTGYDRQYGSLKLLGGSPLGRQRLLIAKILSVVAIEIVQISLVIGLAFALDWSPAGGLLPGAIVLLIGSVAFAGIGLLMAGTLRAEATLALANGAYIVFLLISGIIYPLDKLPDAIERVSAALPAAAFGDALRTAFAGDSVLTSQDFFILCAWAVVLTTWAARRFKWE